MKEALININKQWAISIAENRVKLSRPAQDKSAYHARPQNIILAPSSDGKFVYAMANTPRKLTMTEE